MDSGRSDAELVRRSLPGAEEPFAELVTRHWETAVALAARVLGSGELAQDAAQEATVGALTGLHRLRSPERFGAWFCGIALNVSRRWLHQLRSETPGLQTGDLPSDSPGPAEIAEIADLASRVRDAIAALPSGQRDAVLLFTCRAGVTVRPPPNSVSRLVRSKPGCTRHGPVSRPGFPRSSTSRRDQQ
jgi:RNA polymerase sigma-70 factor (ECF subfamily)